MLDHFTGENVDVRVSQRCGPYIMIEPARITDVADVLRRNNIPFALEEENEACLGTPEAAVIEFAHNADLSRIQQVLDSFQ